jgi:hypothetical protein
MFFQKAKRAAVAAALVAPLLLAPSAVDIAAAQGSPKPVQKPDDGGTGKRGDPDGTGKRGGGGSSGGKTPQQQTDQCNPSPCPGR